MDARFIEALECRRFLSADITGGEPDADASATVLEVQRTPRGSTVTLLGTWRGTVSFDDGDSDTLKLKFTRFSNDRFVGKITSLGDPELALKIKARFVGGRDFSFTFEGATSDGLTSGRGTARLNIDGTRFTGSISGTTNGERYSGSITFRLKS
jgi:hypothetical protein